MIKIYSQENKFACILQFFLNNDFIVDEISNIVSTYEGFVVTSLDTMVYLNINPKNYTNIHIDNNILIKSNSLLHKIIIIDKGLSNEEMIEFNYVHYVEKHKVIVTGSTKGEVELYTNNSNYVISDTKLSTSTSGYPSVTQITSNCNGKILAVAYGNDFSGGIENNVKSRVKLYKPNSFNK